MCAGILPEQFFNVMDCIFYDYFSHGFKIHPQLFSLMNIYEPIGKDH